MRAGILYSGTKFTGFQKRSESFDEMKDCLIKLHEIHSSMFTVAPLSELFKNLL